MRLRFCRLLASVVALFFLAAMDSAAQTGAWTGTWAAAPSAVASKEGSLQTETTLREIVHVSRGGTGVRVTFTNELGTDSLNIAGAHLGLRAQDSTLVPGTDQALTFGGQPSITIPPGAVAVSDPVSFKLPAFSDLAITLLLPEQPLHTMTTHSLGLQTSFEATGDQLASGSLNEAKQFSQWRFLKNVEVSGQSGATIVALGDSITDGHGSTPNANRRWPDVLAQRLQADKRLSGLGVLNEGISGNRVLHDVSGPNALARFDRDVLGQSGVRYLIVMEGINDIGHTTQPRNPGDEVTAQQIIVGLQQIVARAHAHGIKVFGATLTPYMGAGYSSPAGEEMRQAVNTWIRSAGHFDGVIDFDEVTRDPADPSVFLPTYQSGDHLHPSDAGYKAMGDSIDLKLFRP